MTTACFPERGMQVCVWLSAFHHTQALSSVALCVSKSQQQQQQNHPSYPAVSGANPLRHVTDGLFLGFILGDVLNISAREHLYRHWKKINLRVLVAS